MKKENVTLSAPFLLDADVVIGLHELGLWNSIVGHYGKIFLSEAAYKEPLFYYSPTNQKIPINLEPLVKKEQVKILEGKIIIESRILEFLNRFDITERPWLHPGELESLAIIVDSQDMRFCTVDKGAIITLSIMKLHDRGVSLEELISNCGIRRRLEYKHTKEYFGRYIVEGKFRLISNPQDFQL